MEITASCSPATASSNLTLLTGVFSAPDPKMFYKYDGVLADRTADAQEDLPSPRLDNKQTMSKHQQQVPSTARTFHYFRSGAELPQLPVLNK